MTFEERKRIASEILVDFLCDYSTPRGLDDKQMARRIAYAADAFARRMPADGNFSEKVGEVLTRIRDTHESNSWPPQAAFVMAMPKSERKGIAPKTYQSQDSARYARLMSEGVGVPETEVWKTQDVSRDVMDRYRCQSVAKWRDVFSHDAEEKMAAKFGHVVSPYFREAAE